MPDPFSAEDLPLPMPDSDHVERNESLAKVYSTAVNMPIALMFAPTNEVDAMSAMVTRG